MKHARQSPGTSRARQKRPLTAVLVGFLLLPSTLATAQSESGWLRLSSQPETEVFWEGVSLGKTDLQGAILIEGIPAGNYSLLLEKDGYRDFAVRLEIKPGDNRLQLNLEGLTETAASVSTHPTPAMMPGRRVEEAAATTIELAEPAEPVSQPPSTPELPMSEATGARSSTVDPPTRPPSMPEAAGRSAAQPAPQGTDPPLAAARHSAESITQQRPVAENAPVTISPPTFETQAPGTQSAGWPWLSILFLTLLVTSCVYIARLWVIRRGQDLPPILLGTERYDDVTSSGFHRSATSTFVDELRHREHMLEARGDLGTSRPMKIIKPVPDRSTAAAGAEEL